MGSFGGHALPGSFFIIFGIWYTVRIYQMYYRSRQRNTRFTSRIMMDCSFCCGRLKTLPLEAFVKLVFISSGICVEMYARFFIPDEHGNFPPGATEQHATMFFFFGLTGIVDILVSCKVPLPKDIDYLTNALAYGIEGLLFKFHLHGREDLDVLVHTLLVYVIFLTCVAVFVEIYFRHNVLVPLTRCFLMLVQGTWFWHVGYILYHPIASTAVWKQDDTTDMMMATLYFTWHCAVSFVLILLIGAAIAMCNRRNGTGAATGHEMKKMIHSKHNGQTSALVNDDSESELEFERPALKFAIH